MTGLRDAGFYPPLVDSSGMTGGVLGVVRDQGLRVGTQAAEVIIPGLEGQMSNY